MNKNIFIYPIVPKRLSATQNPYISDLIDSLENSGWNVENKKDDRRHGVLSIFNYIRSTDTYYFNWIENLPQKKQGLIQTAIFFFQLLFLKIIGKKIVWTLHNLGSHYSESKAYFFVQSLMLRYSDVIVIHSTESLDFLEKRGIAASRIFYFFHPFDNQLIKKSIDPAADKVYDVLIWGAMNPYKGVLEYVKFVRANAVKHRIHIAGKFKDPDFFQRVREALPDNITIENEFISNDRLIELHNQARYILFPYNGKSVMNSGSLAFSLSLKAAIIGPNFGAFKELGDMGLICTFNGLDDISRIIDSGERKPDDHIEQFVTKSSWRNFARQFSTKFEQANK